MGVIELWWCSPLLQGWVAGGDTWRAHIWSCVYDGSVYPRGWGGPTDPKYAMDRHGRMDTPLPPGSDVPKERQDLFPLPPHPPHWHLTMQQC